MARNINLVRKWARQINHLGAFRFKFLWVKCPALFLGKLKATMKATAGSRATWRTIRIAPDHPWILHTFCWFVYCRSVVCMLVLSEAGLACTGSAPCKHSA
jgi:hypothetical protein